MLCYTGFRVSEFLQLTRFSYHPEDGGYLQSGLKTDAGKNRIVPVHARIRPYLMEWMERGGETIICNEYGKPISSSLYREYFQAIMREIDVPNATPTGAGIRLPPGSTPPRLTRSQSSGSWDIPLNPTSQPTTRMRQSKNSEKLSACWHNI